VHAAAYAAHYPPGRNFLTDFAATRRGESGSQLLVSRMSLRIAPTFSMLVADWSPEFTEESFTTVIEGVRNGPVRAIVRATQSLELGGLFPDAPAGDVLTEDLERLRTKYEQKALADGRSCYYFKRQRRDVSVPNIFPVPVELPMPHAIVSSPVSLEEIGRQFEPVSYTNDATSVRLSELYRSTFHEALLVDAYLNEEPLQQRIMLVITRRMEGDYLIHLHEVGFPRSTPGIHYAVLKLAQWLTGLHSDGKIVSHKLAAEVFETGA
jgi:hypothetical protein